MTDDTEPFLRPFLARPTTTVGALTTEARPEIRPETRPEDRDEVLDDSSETPVVRAYMMTAGTAGGSKVDTSIHLAFESMVSLTDHGTRSVGLLQFERAKIARLVSQQSQSVAEIAANLRIPLGVTQVLCADMVGADLLEHHKSNANLSDDVSLLTRLINGVRSL